MPKIVVCAPHPSDKPLKVLCGLLGRGDVEFAVEPEGCKIVAEQAHPLASGEEDTVKTTTIVGWPSCVKYLSEHTVLWDYENATQEEAWIQEAATALLGDTSIPDLVMTPEEFRFKIEDTLKGYYGTDQTYLVGDYPSVADLCAAIWLEQHKESAGLMGKETKAWLEMILANPNVQGVLTSDLHYD